MTRCRMFSGSLQLPVPLSSPFLPGDGKLGFDSFLGSWAPFGSRTASQGAAPGPCNKEAFTGEHAMLQCHESCPASGSRLLGLGAGMQMLSSLASDSGGTTRSVPLHAPVAWH